MQNRLVKLLAAGVIVLAACGGSEGTSTTEAPTTNPPSTEALTTEPPTTDAPTTETPTTEVPITDPAASEVVEPEGWVAIEPEGDCACSDGSDFEFWERPADPSKVVLYFEGGGACFSAETCGPESETFTKNLNLGESPAGRGGIFDQSNSENPLADHTFVYVPYCSGDVFLGDATTEYSPDVTIRHNGFNNASKGLDHILENYPDVDQLIVAGVSAGSVPTPLFAGLAADGLPDTEIITFGDSSSAYPDDPAINELIGGLWGTTNNIPDWPETEGMTAADWSLPGLYVVAGKHAPRITFARFDYAFDDVQAGFASLVGVPPNAVVNLIDEATAQIEAQGVPLASYIAPGTEHTIIWTDELYTLEVEGVRLIDFLTTLVNGEVPPDVRCVECGAPES